MNILGIDTTGPMASVAVINEQGKIEFEGSELKLNHLQNLVGMVGNVVRKCRLTMNDVNVIAVSEGPGSFTGIRIGVSTARALAQSLDIKTMGIPTLKTFVYNQPDFRGIVCPVFDARRSQVYAGAYRLNGNIEEIVQGGAYDLDEYLSLLKNNCDKYVAQKELKSGMMFFGDGLEVYGDQIKEWQASSLNSDMRLEFAADDNKYQNAASVVRLALEEYKNRKNESLIDFENLKPVYMRKAEAERKLEQERKVLAEKSHE